MTSGTFWEIARAWRGFAVVAVICLLSMGYEHWTIPGDPEPADAEAEPSPPTVSPEDIAQLGQPRDDLSPEELAAFQEGKKLFTAKLPKLGPLYNDQACADCHSAPTVGGGGDRVHVAQMGPGPGGRDVEPYRRHALPGWEVPSLPGGVSRRIAPPLYGLGLIEQIPDQTIRAACGQGHVDSAKQQGELPHNQVARFGAKPFVGTVADFVDSALFSESSVTSPIGRATDDDAFPDPEVDAAFVAKLTAFVRGLRPPGRNGTDAAGEKVFHSLGCAGCHVPDMPPAMNVFSDFCLHRMGDGLADGIIDHEAKGDEFRTAPLQGLRFRRIYLHDGRASTLDGAITAHGGEATASVHRYENATSQEREALLRFLHTL